MTHYRRHIYALLNPYEKSNLAASAVNIFIITLILINVAAASLETVESIQTTYDSIFLVIEVFSVFAFTIEYCLRIWSEPENKKYTTRLNYLISFNSVIDILSIAPFYIGLIFGINLRALVALRLLRLLKLVRYFESLAILGAVIKAEFRAFAAAMFILIILIFIAATGIYFFERGTQPDTFGSIPQSMWWAVVTLTTLGYGDVIPITIAGKVFAALITILSIGTVALPAGMLASRFSEELHNRKKDFSRLIGTLAADGELSNADKEQLEVERLKLCLSEGDVAKSIDEAMQQDLRICPHCGKFSRDKTDD
jgi:voltage-gated potassium channel